MHISSVAPGQIRNIERDHIIGGVQKIPDYLRTFRRNFWMGLNHIVNDYERITKPKRCVSYPLMLNIAITDMCNLGCLHCPRTYDDSIDLGEMKTDQVLDIIDEVTPYTERLQVSGGLGEPLLYDGIYEIIEYAKSKDMKVMMISNGTLLDEESANRLLDLGLDKLTISLDGATKESYEDLRIGADFDEVVSNVSRFCDLREQRNMDIEVQLVPVLFYERNLEELEVFMEVAHDIGVDGVRFNELKEAIDTDEISAEPLRDQEDQEYIQQRLKAAREAAAEYNLAVNFPDEVSKCAQPWKMFKIEADGRVRPCCSGPHDLTVGNILEEGFENVWNGERFVQWREQMTSDDPQQACIDCHKKIP